MNKSSFLEITSLGLIPPLAEEIPYCSPFDIFKPFAIAGNVLLESPGGPEKTARYSFIGIDPYMSFKAKDGIVEVQTKGKRSTLFKSPLTKLRELISFYKQSPLPGLPPFQGGAVGLFAYDFVRYIEKIPSKAMDDLKIPDAHFFFYDRVISFDHKEKKTWAIVSPGLRETDFGYKELSSIDWDMQYDRAEDDLAELKRKLGNRTLPETFLQSQSIEIRHETGQAEYEEMVDTAKKYISAGDIFQANLSMRVSADIGDVPAVTLYETLRSINPSPFACYLDFGDYQIASSSPERLVKVHDGTIETRPIAGTRPRGRDRAEDDLMRAELLLNEKERAEHIMLIDLERNDIGKVSLYGTVEVDELMITEDYSHVIHIVSNVRGRLAPGKDIFSAVRAAFPGGTITGVPKVRCMEIIDELEPVRRGIYTGSVGYLGFGGNMDLNIVIRTFLVKGGRAYVQAGAGIVADSVPKREYLESLKKAEALIKTLNSIQKTAIIN